MNILCNNIKLSIDFHVIINIFLSFKVFVWDVGAVKFLFELLPAPQKVVCFRVYLSFQLLSSKYFCFHKNLTFSASLVLLNSKTQIYTSLKHLTLNFVEQTYKTLLKAYSSGANQHCQIFYLKNKIIESSKSLF